MAKEKDQQKILNCIPLSKSDNHHGMRVWQLGQKGKMIDNWDEVRVAKM